VILVLPGVQPLDLAGPVQVFDTAARLFGAPYTLLFGIDMALWLLEQDCGPRMVADVARRLVVYLRRSGLERQVSVYLEYRAHLDPCVHKVQDWLAEHVSESVSLDELATVGQTSVRSLTRAFKTATGITPREYQRLLRLEVAERLVHDSRLPLETIAMKSGFGDARQFRRVWLKHHGTPPSSSRPRSPSELQG
jgi:transcriptional regulator GlxA family with amidase domain